MSEYKVLIVEDSPTMRQLISFALKRLRGVRIVEASDGVDGLKLVSLVRNDANYRSVPVVVITTEGAQEDRERALALGANDYITKPIQPTKILDVARNLLNIA